MISMLLQTQASRSSPLGFVCELCLVEYFDGGHTNKVNLVHKQSERGAAFCLRRLGNHTLASASTSSIEVLPSSLQSLDSEY